MHPLAERVLHGEVRAAARLMRDIDDRSGDWLGALADLHPHTGRAWIIGVTGNPGAGKSTLTDQLIGQYRKQGQRVGVVAVDPSSPFTGGAILGDRIRMQRHALDAEVFIRSMATRGQLGGLSRSTADVVRVLDAWGAGVIIVETVGVGQDELEIARLAHTTLVVMAPGMGDEVQAIKAGILEIADLFVVNKADREGADATVRDLEMMVGMSHELHHAGSHSFGHHGARLDREAERVAPTDEWITPVVKTVASRGEGVGTLLDAIARHRAWLGETKAGDERRASRARDELRLVFRDLLVEDAMARVGASLEAAAQRVLAREFDPYRAARELLALYRNTSGA